MAQQYQPPAAPAAGYAVVVGGINVDIGGHSFGPLVSADSNPGKVRVSLGGVGRNIAHNMALMGVDVKLLSAVGQDLHGQRVAASCKELGMDDSHVLRVSDCATSTYLYVADHEGEMAIAVSDMEICQRITPQYLEDNDQVLAGARVVVVDTNIPAQTLLWLAEHCDAPLFCDPVSTVKAEKLEPILHKIHTLKPNRLEAQLLSGVEIYCKEDAQKAAEALLQRGVQRVFISMGADGVFAADRHGQLWLQNLPGNMVNTTGCGDAFMAALVWAYLQQLDLKQAALAGLAAGSVAMESAETINPAMSAAQLRQRMAEA